MAVKRYRLTPDAQKIVGETTPNPTWDEYGHLFLVIEEHGEMQIGELVAYLRQYNRENDARMPTDEIAVREGLGALINYGMLEAVEEWL